MRPLLLLLVLSGLFLAGGCTHQSNTVPPRDPGVRTAPHRLLHIYVDSVLPAEGPERNRTLAESIALTLRDQLRLRGFDVRGAEPVVHEASTAANDSTAQLSALARLVTAGDPPPVSSRAATYLHPNSPRLLLFVALLPCATQRPHETREIQLGGFLVDSATGAIVWSGRTSARSMATDQDLRRLTGRLLHSLEESYAACGSASVRRDTGSAISGNNPSGNAR